MSDDPTQLRFKEAIAYFRRKINLPTDDWKTVQGSEQDWAFTIASVTKADMLADFRAAVDRYIAEGVGFQQFAKDFKTIAERYGWQPKQGVAWRANIIASTNLRQSYTAGQYQQRQDPEVKKRRPGLMWRHRDSPQFRPHHLAMDGKVFDGNDPNWSGFSLPSGYGCRCRLFSVPAPESGYFDLSDRLPYTLPDGKQTSIPAVRVEEKLYPIADPGFYYMPGAAPQESRPYVLQQMLARQPIALRQLIQKVLPEFVEADFAGKYVRDAGGRFAKVAGSKANKYNAAARLVEEEKRSGGHLNLVLTKGRTYKDILESEGEAAADRALLSLAKQRVKQMSPTEIDGFKQREQLEKLTAEAESKRELDRRYSLENLQQVGRERTQDLAKELEGIDPAMKGERAYRMLKFKEALLLEGDARNAAKRLNAIDFDRSLGESKESVRSAAALFLRMTNSDLPSLKKIVVDEKRASASRYLGTVDIGQGKQGKEGVVFHEMGHHLEYSNPRIKEAATQWRDSKATGALAPLARLENNPRYEKDEIAVPGNFFMPYVGKIYSSGATEVVSVGLEAFAHPGLMLALWERDRSHFEFIVGVLRA